MRGDGIYRRRDRHNAWYITWSELANGKKRRRHKKVRFQTFDAAKKELAEKQARNQAVASSTLVPIKWRDAKADFLEYQKVHVTPKEYEREVSIVENHLRPFFGGKLVSAISPQEVERFLMERSKKVSAATVRKEGGVLKRFLSYARKKKWIDTNPAADVSLPKAPAGRLRYLHPGEFQALLEHCPPAIRPIVKIAAYTGMRRSEILSLRWLDVDFISRQINLRQSKNGEGRTVYLNDLAVEVFRSVRLDTKTKPEHLVFVLDGAPEELSMAFVRACRKGGIADFRFHDLRHTHASWLRQNGTQLDVIAKQLGHKDLRMTTRYAHLGATQVRDAVNSLDAILRLPERLPAPSTSWKN